MDISKLPTPKQMAERTEANAKEAFDTWMGAAQTKLIISLIPPSEHQEALQSLLLSAFNAGLVAGLADTMTSFSEIFLASFKTGD